MTQVAVGVHVHAEPVRLRATLDSIARNTTREYELLVIPDGADAATHEMLRALTGLRVLADDGPRGGAASLNKLAHNTNAGVVVLLESGARVAPR